MYTVFGWGKNLKPEDLKYEVVGGSVDTTTGNDYSDRCANGMPAPISLTLQIPIKQGEKPAVELFKFQKTQHDTARDGGAGKVAVYQGRDVGQPVQVITIDKAWISRISFPLSPSQQFFFIQLTIMAGSVELSDVKFEDVRKTELVA